MKYKLKIPEKFLPLEEEKYTIEIWGSEGGKMKKMPTLPDPIVMTESQLKNMKITVGKSDEQ